MTDKRIPLDAQYGYAKPVKEITAEQWEAFRKTPYMVVTEESSVALQIIPDAQQIIEAAVQAWDVVDSAGCPQRTEEGYLLNPDEAIIEFMKPHMQALKGLIDV